MHLKEPLNAPTCSCELTSHAQSFIRQNLAASLACCSDTSFGFRVFRLGVRLSISLRLVSRFVVLPWVSFAFARGHHRDLVGPGGPVLTLELNALGPGLVVHAAPVLTVSAVPELSAVSADPVGQHLSGKTLSRAHQLLNWVYAGALAVRNVLCRAQLPAANWDSFCKTKRKKL